jgi:hypothetical protein
LLPTGLLLAVTVNASDKFEEVKRQLWTLAESKPLFQVLKVCVLWGNLHGF